MPVKFKHIGIAAAVLATAAAGIAYAKVYQASAGGDAAAKQAAVAPAQSGAKVLAVVNGEAVSDVELAPILAQGVDRAVAVDRYINKVLAADLARSKYGKDAEDALRGAEREILSQLYVTKRTESLMAGVTDEEVKAFYEANVKADDYTGYKVFFLVTQDPKDAEAVAQAIAAGRAKDVEARFKPAKDGDGFIAAAEMPFGLGSILRGLKVGEYSRPLVLRNGIFLLHLQETKANPRPELAKVSAEIKNLIVARKLSEELEGARRSAKVELK